MIFGWCPECCVGSPMPEWRQEGDGYRCPDCGANVAKPVGGDDLPPMTPPERTD